MKVSGKTTRTTVIDGEISVEELAAYLRLTLHVPEGVDVKFYAGEPPHDIDLNVGVPLRFSLVLFHQQPVFDLPASPSSSGPPFETFTIPPE